MLRPGDVITVRGKSQSLEIVANSLAGSASEVRKYPWLEVNPDKFQGTFISLPERSQIPEKINEQLIVELYSK